MSSVLITGTSRGIGFETALAFGRAGHMVFATMRNPAKSPELAQVAAKEKLSITVSAMDVDSDDSVRDAIAAIQKENGPIDVLVNNAGIERTGSIEDLPLEEFRAVMETNYFGAIRCIQAVVPEMRKRRSGCIINLSSVAGRTSLAPLTPYCASKWALEALTEGLAGEMKMFGVRVVMVEPGIIETAMPHRISEPHASTYPQEARVANLFAASLQNHVPPSLVADAILKIAQSNDWKLRHPVGPDAEPLIQWRRSMTDEQWVDLQASPDDVWYARIKSDFGMDTRPTQQAQKQGKG